MSKGVLLKELRNMATVKLGQIYISSQGIVWNKFLLHKKKLELYFWFKQNGLSGVKQRFPCNFKMEG